MRSQGTKRDKKQAKSAEKRYNIKKNQLNMLLYKNMPLPEKLLLRAE
jgi:hypothetical protein